MTMLVGYVWGKRYTSMQSELGLLMACKFVVHAELASVFSVAMLTAGIGVAAMADAQAKVYSNCILSPRFLWEDTDREHAGQNEIDFHPENRFRIHHGPCDSRCRSTTLCDYGNFHRAHVFRIRQILA